MHQNLWSGVGVEPVDEVPVDEANVDEAEVMQKIDIGKLSIT